MTSSRVSPASTEGSKSEAGAAAAGGSGRQGPSHLTVGTGYPSREALGPPPASFSGSGRSLSSHGSSVGQQGRRVLSHPGVQGVGRWVGRELEHVARLSQRVRDCERASVSVCGQECKVGVSVCRVWVSVGVTGESLCMWGAAPRSRLPLFWGWVTQDTC